MKSISAISDVSERDLKTLLNEIHQHNTRLPSFQRGFVWSAAAIKRLLGSVGNSYPIGSILRVKTKNGNSPLGARLFEPYDDKNVVPSSDVFQFMVLDGQQRLTSLLHVFYGLGDYLFFIDFKKLTAVIDDSEDFEDAIEVVKRSQINRLKYDDNDVLRDRWLMPCTYLSDGGYFRWKGEISANIDKKNDAKFSNFCSNITDYKIPVVTLKEDIELDALCTIFESINNSGKQLTPFELVNAKIYGSSETAIELSKKYKEAITDYPALNEKQLTDYTILQVITLLATYNSTTSGTSCKKKDVLQLKVADIDNWWDKTILSANFVIGNLLKNDCGLFNSSYLPYKSVLIPLIAIVAHTKFYEKTDKNVGAIRADLIRWYWNVVFAQIYETSTDTRGAKDFNELVSWITQSGSEPENMQKNFLDGLDLREYDNPNSGIYRGVLCLASMQKPRDFYSGSPVDTFENIDDHHVFPDAFLKNYVDANGKKPYNNSDKLRNNILNRALISSTTNKKIQAKKPSVYIRDIKSTYMLSSKFIDMLKSHLLPHEDITCYENNDYELFLKQREKIIIEQIKIVTGRKNLLDTTN